MHNLSFFGVRTNHGQTRTHKTQKTHHNSNLGEATTFPFIVYYVVGHGISIQMAFFPGVPKLELLQLWGPIILSSDLRLKWGLKQSCSPRLELSNGMWHATCTQGNQGISQLLVVRSQTANLTPNPSFGHNLCFRCPNGWCKPISDIYVPKDFQWYKERFNPMSFDPCNHLLKIEVHLGVWGFIPSHSFALPGAWDVTLGLPS
jgi:hypothetical protein